MRNSFELCMMHIYESRSWINFWINMFYAMESDYDLSYFMLQGKDTQRWRKRLNRASLISTLNSLNMIIRLFFSRASYQLFVQWASIITRPFINFYDCASVFKEIFFLSTLLLKLIFLRHLDRSKHCSMCAVMNREKANYASWKLKSNFWVF